MQLFELTAIYPVSLIIETIPRHKAFDKKDIKYTKFVNVRMD